MIGSAGGGGGALAADACLADLVVFVFVVVVFIFFDVGDAAETSGESTDEGDFGGCKMVSELTVTVWFGRRGFKEKSSSTIDISYEQMSRIFVMEEKDFVKVVWFHF